MKDFLRLFIFFAASMLHFSSSFGQIPIGTGTVTGQALPLEPYYEYTYSEQIYLASDIGTSGNITGVQFFLASTNLLPNTQDIKIYVGHTTKSSYSNATDWETNVGLTLVYSGNLPTTGTAGWISLPFTSAFAYNGTDNLIIAVEDDEPDYDSDNDDFYCTATSNAQSITYRSDSTNPDPASPPTATGIRNYIPNIIIDGLIPPTPPNCDAILTNTTDINIAGDISWSAATGSPTSYRIDIGTTPGGMDIANNVNQTGTSYAAGPLNPGTTYYVTITPGNANGPATGCTEQTFTTGSLADCPTLSAPLNGAIDQPANVTVSWTAATTGVAADSYNLYFGTTSGALVFAGGPFTGTAATFNGLPLNTTHYWAVAPITVAGENTACISTEFSFTTISPPPAPSGVTCTAGGSSSVLYTDELDTQGNWTGDFGFSDGDWKFGGSTGSPGTGATSPQSGSAFMYYEASGSVTNTASAVSPAIDLSGASDEAELSFYLHAFGRGIGTLEVGVANTAAGPFTNILTWSGPIQTAQADPFYQVGLDVSTYIGGDLYVEFKQTGTGEFSGDMSIDLLEVTSCVNCPLPSALTASGVTTTSANLAWTENGSATAWDIELVDITASGTASGAVTHNDITNPYALTSLTPNNDYEYYVRADCDMDDTNVSAWVGPFAFSTLIDFCAPSALFTDSGGAGTHSANENITTTICPDNAGDKVAVSFTSFLVEGSGIGDCWDELMIYNGADNTAPTIPSPGVDTDGWCYQSLTDGTGDLTGKTVVSTDASGCLTFVFTSDNSGQFAGWEATINCASTAPYATNIVPSSAAAITSDNVYITGDGWHNYHDGTNLLLSLKLGNTSAQVAPTAVTVDAGGATDSYLVQGTPGNFVNNPDGAAFMRRKWDVTAGSQPTIDVPVRFYYTTAEYDAVNTEISNSGGTPLTGQTQLQFYKVLNGDDPFTVGNLLAADAVELENGATAANDTWTYSAFGTDHYAEMTVASFSGGGGGGTSGGNVILPAELTIFTGKAMNKYNALTWETALEVNTYEFAIERSVNGRDNWEVIGTERAAGNSEAVLTYAFDDMRPLSQSYYRLRIIDLDGSAQVSSIVSLKREATGFDVVLVAPNPTTATTNVTFESLEEVTIEAIVTDVTGKVIQVLTQETTQGLNNLEVDLSQTPNGVYFLSLNNGVKTVTNRIIKN